MMNANKLLVGCSSCSSFYSIISLKDRKVVRTGKMNEPRTGYGLVKIQDMYYAVLGCKSHENTDFSSSIDIFEHKSVHW